MNEQSRVRLPNTQYGMSLVEVMVAMTILGVLVMILMRMASNATTFQNAMDMNAQVNEVRSAIRAKTSCVATAASLSPESPLLRDARGLPIGATPEFRYGAWMLRSSYQAGRDHVAVDVRYVGPAGGSPNPRLMKAHGAQWSPLFSSGGIHCREILNPPKPSRPGGGAPDSPNGNPAPTDCVSGTGYFGKREDGKARCCRRVAAQSAAPNTAAFARCTNLEFPVFGGVQCSNVDPASLFADPMDFLNAAATTNALSNGTAMLASHPSLESNVAVGWQAQCVSNHSVGAPVWAVAFAQCCPF